MQDSEMRDKLEKIIKAYEELQAKMSDPAVLADQKEYNKLAKEYSDQGELVEKSREYLQACADIDEAKEMLGDPDMKEFAQETISAAEAKLPSLEEDIKFLLIPSDPADEKDIIVEIRAAAGGDEAAIFAGDLFKMYERFCSSRKWKIELMDVSPSDAGGYKEVQFKVKGDKVYSVMKFESGVHRVQRVPKTESQGRIHTSTATVAVLPEADEVEVDINENDLRIDVYRAGGPGGRHAGHGENGALGGLHNRLVGGGHAEVQGDGQVPAVDGLALLDGLGKATEQQGQDDAGVTTGAPQQSGGGRLGGQAHGGILVLFQLNGCRADGQAHVGAGITIGHREHVEVVDLLLFSVDRGGRVDDHLLKGRRVNGLCHIGKIPFYKCA